MALLKIVQLERILRRKFLGSYGRYNKVFGVKLSTVPHENWVYNLEFVKDENTPKIPAYRVMDEQGKILDPSQEPKLENSLLIKLYKAMVELNIAENILFECQRQGRISFFMTGFGEEAIQFGSAAALSSQDLVYGQYREAGILLWRGFTVENMIDQCYGNDKDVAKGKQMPVHYGSKGLNFVTISSPLTTQLPQAVGSAYAYKREKAGRCVAVYFGEGAASEGDAHAAFNFASVLQTPTIFICRNNGYAISTPTHEQYGGDGIASKGPAYGIPTFRIDGNDLLASYNATVIARNHSVKHNRPVLIEAVTYRVSHHSTSDDSSAYRSLDEIKQWQKYNPITRFRMYLESKQLWNSNLQAEYENQTRSHVLEAIKNAEKTKKPSWREMFEDVYFTAPASLKNQRNYMQQHIKKFENHYPVNN